MREREQFSGYGGRPYTGTRHVCPVSYRVYRTRYAPGSKSRGCASIRVNWAIWKIFNRKIHKLILGGDIVFNFQIENSPSFEYLAVKEEEASLLPVRLCDDGLEVSKDPDQSASPFGIATF